MPVVLDRPLRSLRKLAVAALGGATLLAGCALLVLPGPAFVVIPIGLTILGLEFAWARRWLGAVRDRSGRAWGALQGRRGPTQVA